jgi:mannose/cellobiose epimerase-like protein (N-acyl-D-glucosamine 2-epimerase family)
MNVQMHALEAVANYCEAGGDAQARERLAELTRIETATVYRERWGACSDAHRPDWTPLLDAEHARTSYGHDVENISLVLEACRVSGLDPAPFLPFFRTTFQTALRWGWDASRHGGGFFKEGPLGRPAEDRTRSWWVQAEALAAALELVTLTGDGLYGLCYLRLLEWIERRHVDWRYGEWHAEPLRRGVAAPDKAGPWKEPYHTGRSVLRALELARAVDRINAPARRAVLSASSRSIR